MIVRNIRKRGIALGAMTGAVLLAFAPAARAEATASPEGIGIVATGPVAVEPTPDATSANPNPASVASQGVVGLLTANALTAQVAGNTTTSGMASVTPLAGAPVAISAGAVAASCTANSDASFTETSSAAALSIPGVTVPVNPAPNTVLTVPLLGTVTLNEQVAGPVTGSQTVTAIHIHTLVGEDVYLASSTCGPYVAPVPLASGSGLAAGLGLTGVAGGAVAIVTLNRRRRRVTGA
jgi:hypothetical protein